MESYTYDEYGNQKWTEYDSNGDPVEATDEIFDNEVTFTSSITDTSTGLQYMASRYYNAKTGTFLTQDTYTGNAYEPWTQHLYSYCGNNPTNMIDPTGHVPSFCMACSDGGNNTYAPVKRKGFKVTPEQVAAHKAGIPEETSDNGGNDGTSSAFGATSTNIQGISTETDYYIVDTGFSYTYSTGTAEVDGNSGWLASVGGYGDYRTSPLEPGACWGVTLDLFTVINLDLHYDADGVAGVDVGLNIGDTTGTVGVELGNPLAGQPIGSVHYSNSTTDSNNNVTTSTYSVDVGPFGVAMAVLIAATNGLAAALLPGLAGA